MDISLGKTVTFRAPKEGVSPTADKVTLVRFIDNPDKRVVLAWCAEFTTYVVLWSGDAYDAIGDWTQTMAEARIIEKVLAKRVIA